MSAISTKVFRLIIALLGVVNVLLGINVGAGGIVTLGWQGQAKFFEVTNEAVYLMRDSHIRFFGGLYLGVGLFLLLAATNLRRYSTALHLVFTIIFIGGLARLTAMRLDVIFGQEVIGSLLAELVLMPILAIWLAKIVKPSALDSEKQLLR